MNVAWHWITHRQPMLAVIRIKNSNLVPGGLLDQRNKVTQRFADPIDACVGTHRRNPRLLLRTRHRTAGIP